MERGHAAFDYETNALCNRRKHGMRMTDVSGLAFGVLLATTSLLQAQTIPEYKSVAETWDRSAATLSAMFPHHPCGVVVSEFDEFDNRETVNSEITCDTGTYSISSSPAGDSFTANLPSNDLLSDNTSDYDKEFPPSAGSATYSDSQAKLFDAMARVITASPLGLDAVVNTEDTFIGHDTLKRTVRCGNGAYVFTMSPRGNNISKKY